MNLEVRFVPLESRLRELRFEHKFDLIWSPDDLYNAFCSWVSFAVRSWPDYRWFERYTGSTPETKEIHWSLKGSPVGMTGLPVGLRCELFTHCKVTGIPV